MKKIKIKPLKNISLLLLVFALILSSCTKEEETVIVPKTLAEYKTEYSQFVASEKAIVEKAVIGYNKGNYRVSISSTYPTNTAAYLAALNAAQLVLNKPDLTITDIANSNKTLGTPGRAFLNSLFISDRTPLVAPIEAAEALNTATIVGTASGQVSQTAKTAFTTAIAAAKTTRDATTTIERQVVEALDKLNAARTAFTAAIIK